MSGNPDFTNNSLAYPDETFDDEIPQAKTRSGHNGRGQAKVQTKDTCAVSQEERVLNICEIGYEIHVSLNCSFKLGVVILILFNIKPF